MHNYKLLKMNCLDVPACRLRIKLYQQSLLFFPLHMHLINAYAITYYIIYLTLAHQSASAHSLCVERYPYGIKVYHNSMNRSHAYSAAAMLLQLLPGQLIPTLLYLAFHTEATG